MTQPYTGGCACGAVRYEITSEPIAMQNCQCRQCQHTSGTGHISNLTFLAKSVETTGKVSAWQCRGDGGTLKESAFCPKCGSPVYLTFPDLPDYFIVRAGSLDDPDRFEPHYVTWAAAARAWDAQPDGITVFEHMPTSG